MTEAFTAIRQGAVLEVVFAPPPQMRGAVLDGGARRALTLLLHDLQPDVRAVLIRPGSRPFAAQSVLPGPDDAKAPDLATLCATIEGARVPVVFLIDGRVSGPLAEVALAAHLRLVLPQATLAPGAASVGRILGAGGIRRLAALIGAEQALRVMQTGVAVGAPEAVALGLVDGVVEGDTRAAMMARATDLAAQGTRRVADVGLRDARGFLGAVAVARKAAAPHGGARQALIDCVEAAILLPRDQGLAFEAAVGKRLDSMPETVALCHIHLAEQNAAAPLAGPPPPQVAHLGLSGAALALLGPVLTALSRGVSVTVADADREALVGFLRAVAARQEAAVQSGKVSQTQREAEWVRLTPATDVAALEACDLVIASDGAKVPASRPVLMMGAAAMAPGAFGLGVVARVAELALPEGADAAHVGIATAFLRRAGLMVVVTGAQSATGIAERLAAVSGDAVRVMAAMGVAPEAIVAALTGFGLPEPKLSRVGDVLPRAMPEAEIVNRLLAAMANEGVRLIASGKARSALDVDLVAVRGLGFARTKGGPMHQADTRGLLVVRRDLALWAPDAEVWRAVPAWDGLVSAGRGFAAAVRPDLRPEISPDLSPKIRADLSPDPRPELSPDLRPG